MKYALIVAIVLTIAFSIGLYFTLIYPRQVVTSQIPPTREFTLQGASVVPNGTTPATILGSISVSTTFPAGSTINVDARPAGSLQFSTVLQNLPAATNQTFSYTKATSGASYDMQVTLLDPTGKVIGTSEVVSVTAPTLNARFTVNPLPSPTPTLTPTPTPAGGKVTPTPAALSGTPTPTPTPASASASLSGDISFHGEAPVNSRVVVLEKLGNASTYQVAVDNLTPVDGTLWQWNGPVGGDSYSVIAVLKQKQSDGSDTDIASSAPVTITAPAGFIVLTVNSAYTLLKPTGTPSVNCQTYNGGPNQNYWTVTVGFPSVTGAQSYWLEVGSTSGANDIVNASGNSLSAQTIFDNNTTYYARFAYAAVARVDTASGQFSVFSDATKLTCGK